MLVRFLSGREEQVTRCRNTTDAPTLSQLYTEPGLLATNPQFPHVLEVFHEGVVSRPTKSAGKMYPEVSRAYWEAVHSVLTRQESASQSADELQDKLERMLRKPDVRASADLSRAAAQR
jgi:trehalose/maltose transport system substrate-binding protein